jgi:hypothetical protein
VYQTDELSLNVREMGDFFEGVARVAFLHSRFGAATVLERARPNARSVIERVWPQPDFSSSIFNLQFADLDLSICSSKTLMHSGLTMEQSKLKIED